MDQARELWIVQSEKILELLTSIFSLLILSLPQNKGVNFRWWTFLEYCRERFKVLCKWWEGILPCWYGELRSYITTAPLTGRLFWSIWTFKSNPVPHQNQTNMKIMLLTSPHSLEPKILLLHPRNIEFRLASIFNIVSLGHSRSYNISDEDRVVAMITIAN